jgi:O-antigen ligase
LCLFGVLPVGGLIAGPVYAPAVFGVAVVGFLWRRAWPQVDRPLAGLAGAFIALSWLGVVWSISPARTEAGALQATLVLPGALAFLAVMRGVPAGRAWVLARVVAVACLVGAVMLVSDRVDHFVLLKALDGKGVWPTKYNRGIDYFSLILLPVLGFCVAARRWRLVGGLCLALVVTVAAGRNTTAQVALPVAILVGVVGALAPRVVAVVLGVATAAEALGLPFAMRVVTHFRPEIAAHIKLSGVERLEIWDYLSAHVLQRPLFGWGLWSSRLLPATPEEMAHFVKAQGSGIYPHNQWLELWVETGLPGVLIGLGLVVLVLRRVLACDPALRPFGYATFVMAIAVASSGFEITTDSWWAALAASAGLFGVFGRSVVISGARILGEASLGAPAGHPGTIGLRGGAPEPRRNRQAWRTRVPGGR